jgi:SEC-C motif-containing protein
VTTNLDSVRAALDACDFDAAVVRLAERARSGEDVPAELACAALEGVVEPETAAGLIAIATGDRAGALIDVLRRRRLVTAEPAVEAIALYAAWRLGAPVAAVVAEARRLSRGRLEGTVSYLLAAITEGIGDAHLAAAMGKLDRLRTPQARRAVAEIDRLLQRPAAEALAALPTPDDLRVVSGFTVRAAERAGRNDPCPCGSGKKYKRCCADKDAAAVAGISWERPKDVEALLPRELARLPLAELSDAVLAAAIRRLVTWQQWTLAAAAIDELARRPDGAREADTWREELVYGALLGNEPALARAQHARMSDPARDELHNGVALALLDGAPGALAAVAQSASKAVADDDAPDDISLAHALLRAAPALGLLVARGCVRPGREADVDILLDAIEEARDELALPPGDPAWDLWELLDEAKDRTAEEDDQRTRSELATLRTQLADSSSRLGDLTRDLAAKQRELEAAREQPALPVSTARDESQEQTKRLARRVEELQGLIREGNQERRDLRAQLSAAERERAPAAAAVVEQPDEAAEGDDVELGQRAVAIPSFGKRALDALARLPGAIAAEAMRTLGGLTAGDGFSWRGVKQARDMVRPVLMARIGIHHRMLFRVEERTLTVLDIVTREELMLRLKQVRANRE